MTVKGSEFGAKIENAVVTEEARMVVALLDLIKESTQSYKYMILSRSPVPHIKLGSSSLTVGSLKMNMSFLLLLTFALLGLNPTFSQTSLTGH